MTHVEPAEQRSIEDGPMVRGGNDDALRTGLLEEDEERVEDPAAPCADVVARSVATRRVELVEEIDGTLA
ncbi:MAG: hypothetical protein U5K29_04020 [Acidimicrobiales bacterium]|nr:hypothetical protein [Acidimicrobiales bacterium]